MRTGKWHVSPGFRRFQGGTDMIKWRAQPWGIEAEVTRSLPGDTADGLPRPPVITEADIPWKVLAQMLVSRDSV
jgi:hypothetical protein